MTGSTWPVFDTTTGAIVKTGLGSEAEMIDNLPVDHDYIDGAGDLYPSPDYYVDDPTGTPTMTVRPDFDCVIPATVTEGDDLSIPDVPDGAAVEITSTGGGGGSHTKSGGPGTLDAAVTGAADGDVLTVDIALFPYRPMTGTVDVVAPP